MSFHPSLASPQHIVTLKSSKTDFSRAGQSLLIAQADTPVCAVAAMQHYFQSMSPWPGLLFSFQSGRLDSTRLLTRSAVICLLHDGARHTRLPYHSLKGHSFCIGTASTAAAAGLPDWLIKVLGRWSSDCYQLYIRTPQQVLLSAAPRMSRITFYFSFNFSFVFLFACFSFCLGGYLLHVYLWRLSLRSDFPKLS